MNQLAGTSIIARLRNVPRRPGSDPTSLMSLHDRQARLLRYLTAASKKPIELAIAELPTIRVEAADIPTSGLSYWDGRRWIIRYNVFEPRTRQRFTICHEFKHIVDHPNWSALYGALPRPAAVDAMERAADYFAGCALAPTDLLIEAWATGVRSERAMASRFDVSTQAIRVRLAQVGLSARVTSQESSNLRTPAHDQRQVEALA